MKKTRLPLLLAVLLTLMMPVVTTISTPNPVLAKTQMENSGQEMDGDPENYSDGSPKSIRAEKGADLSEETPNQTRWWLQLLTWLWIAIARVSHGF